MIRSLASAAACAALVSCVGSNTVQIHRPLGGFPDEPSTVHGRVKRIDVQNGMLVVAVKTVNGNERRIVGFVYIDENTIFTNSAGGTNVRTWEELQNAEIVIKGWYHEEEYFADEIDVVAFHDPPAAPLPRM